MKKVYSGHTFIKLPDDEASLWFCDGDEAIAETIESDVDQYGRFLSVRYYIADEKMPPEELTENFVKKCLGFANVEFNVLYTAITGFCYCNEELFVGGHDLLEELKTHVGKYTWLEIEYSNAQL
jgi:hypothetical protein